MRIKSRLNLLQLITIAVILVLLLQMTTNMNNYASGTHLSSQQVGQYNYLSYTVETNITETLAETNVTRSYDNPNSVPVEISFYQELPKGAFLTNASFTTRNLTFWAKIMRIEEAQESYENATSEGRNAVLISKISDTMFKVELNLANFTQASISLYYTQRLVRNLGSYKLDIYFSDIMASNVKPGVFKHVIDMEAPNRDIKIISSPNSYTMTNYSSRHIKLETTRTFFDSSFDTETSIFYTLSGSPFGSNVFAYTNGTDNFFVATFTPTLEVLGKEQVSKDFIFIIDVSGSMSGTRLSQAKSALLEIIDDLHQKDKFNIVKFSDFATLASQSMIARSDSSKVASMKQWVNNLRAGGSTNILDALITGFNSFDMNSQRTKIMVLLTDGDPTAGETNTDAIVDQFTQLNGEGQVSLFSLGFGSGVSFEFLQSLARENNGEAYEIMDNENAAEQISKFYDEIKAPILVNLKVTAKQGLVGSLYPYFLPNLYEGSELLLVGKMNIPLTLEINGTDSDNIEHSWLISSAGVSNSSSLQWVEQTYAITLVDDLLTQIFYLSDYDVSKPALVEKVIALSLHYGIVTPYTALFIDIRWEDIPVTPPDEGLLPGQLPTYTTQPGTTQGGTSYHVTRTTIAYNPASGAGVTPASLNTGFVLLALLVLPLIGIKMRKRKNQEK